MPFTVSEHANIPVFHIKGKFLGSLEGEAFRARIEELKEAGKTNVVVDLGSADFMDSSGMGLLISGLTTLRRADGDMRLAAIEDRIKNLFLITRVLGPVFTDYPTVEAATESYSEA